MNQNLLDHVDKALRNKAAPIRRESEVDFMKKMLGLLEHEYV